MRFPPLVELVIVTAVVCVALIAAPMTEFGLGFVADYAMWSRSHTFQDVVRKTFEERGTRKKFTFELAEPIDTEIDIPGKWQLYHHLREAGLDSSHILEN